MLILGVIIGAGLLLAVLLAAFCLVALATAQAMADPKIMGPVDTGKALQAAAVTKTATFNGASIDMGSGFAPTAGQSFQGAFPVSAADFVSGNESYSFQMEQSTDNSTFVAAGAAVLAVAGDVGGSVVINGTISARYVRYTVTIAGTTPSITYGPAYLVPRGGR